MSANKMFRTLAGLALCLLLVPGVAAAKTAQQIEAEVNAALAMLYKQNGAAKELAGQAKGILVFPKVVKGGFIVGAAHGTGALRIDGTTEGYYQTTSGSLGFQAGIESRSEVIMFMTEDALNKFRASDGWEAGVDGSITVIQTGASGEVSTTNQQKPIIAYIFGNEGFFGGVNLEGAKISHYTPE